MNESRRKFLKTAGTAAIGAAIIPSLLEIACSPSEQKKNSGNGKSNGLEAKTLYDDPGVPIVGNIIARGIGELDKAAYTHDYKAPYKTFLDAYSASAKEFNTTHNQVYNTLKIVSLMHASKTLIDSGNRIVEGRDFGANLRQALEHYKVALELRKQLGDDVNNVKIPKYHTNGVPVADEKTIRKRMNGVLDPLIEKYSLGEEHTEYMIKARDNVARLKKLSDGVEKLPYEAQRIRLNMRLSGKQ